MALFTDAAVVTLDDLLPFEASLVQVASSHGINVDTKISLATAAIGDKLLLWLLDAGASDPQWLTRRRIGLSTVVVTPTLHRWICFESLARIFAEAYNVQLNTRFQGKWTEYQTEAKNAADLCFLSGAGIVYRPLPKPQIPLVSVQAGTAPAQVLYVQTSWVDARGNESALSPVNGSVLTEASSIVVAMTEGALDVPSAAMGWNIYVSSTQNDQTRQNGSPLEIGATWQLPASGLVSGARATNGQPIDIYIPLLKQVRRG
jgi:hypothetical protein